MGFLLSTFNVKDYETELESMSLWGNANEKTAMYGYMTVHYFFFFELECYTLNRRNVLSHLPFFCVFFLGVDLLHLCPRCGKENLNVQRGCSARRWNIPQGCRRKSGSSRRLVMFWPQCKSISAILLMNWSMIYTVSGACFLLPPLAKCWQCLCVFSGPFMLLWVSWFVLFILNSRSSLVASW